MREKAQNECTFHIGISLTPCAPCPILPASELPLCIQNRLLQLHCADPNCAISNRFWDCHRAVHTHATMARVMWTQTCPDQPYCDDNSYVVFTSNKPKYNLITKVSPSNSLLEDRPLNTLL